MEVVTPKWQCTPVLQHEQTNVLKLLPQYLEVKYTIVSTADYYQEEIVNTMVSYHKGNFVSEENVTTMAVTTKYLQAIIHDCYIQTTTRWWLPQSTSLVDFFLL